MTDFQYDVLGVGNAIVDVLAQADDAFLADHDIVKGGMTLIDEARADALYGAMGPGVEISGGSAANSIAALASLGGRGAFIGKVFDDQLGGIYRHDLRSLGVAFDTVPARSGPGTGRCLINVTPDAQRSMSTFLGAAGGVSVADIDRGVVEASAVTFFEGYLFEQPTPREAFFEACAIARKAGRKTALTLSDSGCVERQYAAFLDFIKSSVDILFANEAEALALAETSDLAAALEKLEGLAPFLAVTRSEKGSVIVTGGARTEIPTKAPKQLVDTTGAGDAYAAGVLCGVARGLSPEVSGRLGSLAASEVISHYGARPETSLKGLAEADGLLT
ncbi:MAG: adenosine kinase [Pseudomonadota bacterium]